MSKKFEYVDDNPGSYFGMLVENWENLNEDEKNFRNWIEKKVGKQMSNMKPTKIGYRHGRPYYSVDFVDGTSDDYFIDFDKKEIEKCESLKEDSEYKTLAKLSNGLEVISYPYGYAVSDGYVSDRFVVRDGKYIFDDGRFRLSDKDKQKILSLINKGVIDESLKEDKFVSRDKMSKKAQKELNDKKRGTWGNTNPVTRVQPNKKAYDRKRDKKELDESSGHILSGESIREFRDAFNELESVYNEMSIDVNNKNIVYYGDALHYYERLKEIADMVYNSFFNSFTPNNNY